MPESSNNELKLTNTEDEKVSDIIRWLKILNHPTRSDESLKLMTDAEKEVLHKALFEELVRMNELLCGGEIEIYKIN